MSDENKKPKGQVITIPRKSIVADYQQPMIHNVATEITAIGEEFIPKYRPGTAYVDLLANISEIIKILPMTPTIVDCGFSVILPAGYKMVVSASDECKKLGLMIDGLVEGKDIKIVVVNVSPEAVMIAPKAVLAQMSVEPIYLIEWIIKK